MFQRKIAYSKDDLKLLRRLNKRELVDCITEKDLEIRNEKKPNPLRKKTIDVVLLKDKRENKEYVGYLYPPSGMQKQTKMRRKVENKQLTLYQCINLILSLDREIRRGIFVRIEKIACIDKSALTRPSLLSAALGKLKVNFRALPDKIYFLMTPKGKLISDVLLAYREQIRSAKKIKELPAEVKEILKGIKKLLEKSYRIGLIPEDLWPTNVIYYERKDDLRLIDVYDLGYSMTLIEFNEKNKRERVSLLCDNINSCLLPGKIIPSLKGLEYISEKKLVPRFLVEDYLGELREELIEYLTP